MSLPATPSRSEIREWRTAYPLTGSEVPESVADVVRLGIVLADPDRIVLYGSRARGSAREDSDYDHAFFGVRDRRGIRRLRADLIDGAITLRQVDILDAQEASADLLRNLESEGRVIYERPPSTADQLPARPGKA